MCVCVSFLKIQLFSLIFSKKIKNEVNNKVLLKVSIKSDNTDNCWRNVIDRITSWNNNFAFILNARELYHCKLQKKNSFIYLYIVCKTRYFIRFRYSITLYFNCILLSQLVTNKYPQNVTKEPWLCATVPNIGCVFYFLNMKRNFNSRFFVFGRNVPVVSQDFTVSNENLQQVTWITDSLRLLGGEFWKKRGLNQSTRCRMWERRNASNFRSTTRTHRSAHALRVQVRSCAHYPCVSCFRRMYTAKRWEKKLGRPTGRASDVSSRTFLARDNSDRSRKRQCPVEIFSFTQLHKVSTIYTYILIYVIS